MYLKSQLHYAVSWFIHKETICRKPNLHMYIVYEKKGEYFYYQKHEAGLNHPLYCRKKGSLDAEEEIYFNPNKYAKDYKYYDISVRSISPDHNLLAFSVDTTGDEIYTLFILDLKTKKLLPDSTNEGTDRLEWLSDSRTFLFVSGDGSPDHIPFKIKKHTIGNDIAKAEILLDEGTGPFEAELQKSDNGKYLFLVAEKKECLEYQYLRTDDINGVPQKLISRDQKLDNVVKADNDFFYIWFSNDEFPNGKIVKAKIGEHLDPNNWQNVIPYSKDYIIEKDFKVFNEGLAFYQKSTITGLKQIGILTKGNKEPEYLQFPAEIHTPFISAKQDYTSGILNVGFDSPITPVTKYKYDFKTKKLNLASNSQHELDSDLYEVKRVYVASHDSAHVPVTIFYRKDRFNHDGNNPAYIYAYGSYGYNHEPEFYPSRISLLDRGVVFCIAHVRGSSTLGKEWHNGGRVLKRKNRIYDLIAVTEHLIKEKYTSKDKVIINGESAGGDLMLAVANFRPDLFKVVLANVPECTVLQNLTDHEDYGTIYHYPEMGDTRIKEHYNYIKSFCPYENIEDQNYPHVFINAGMNDSRVSWYGPAKLNAKLREHNTGKNLTFMQMNMHGGHFESGNAFSAIAEEYAFALKMVGIDE